MSKLNIEITDSITLQDAILKMLIYSKQTSNVNVDLPDIVSDTIAGIYRGRGFSIANPEEDNNE